eukprot:5011142-Pyramimonas_sp.AAC.1
MTSKGHSNVDRTMQDLAQDISPEGHLYSPAKWGLPLSDDQKKQAEQERIADDGDESAGKGKGTLAQELDFWKGVADNAFK